MQFNIGDIVNSSSNYYGNRKACVIDRIYERGGIKFCRLIFSEKRINVIMSSCKMDVSYLRDIRLKYLDL